MNRVAVVSLAAAAITGLGCEVDRSHLTSVERTGASDPPVTLADAATDVATAQPGPSPDAGVDPAPTPMPPGAADAAPAPPSPVACQVSDWGDWSACSRPCGGGKQMRMRTVVSPPAHGGMGCPPLVEIQDCNLAGCPVDCQVSDWSAWSECSKACGGGQQTRTRTVIAAAGNGGMTCPPLAETRACNPAPVNACGGCVTLAEAPGDSCGRCGKVACAGSDSTRCDDPGRTCQALGATCGAPPDGCGGRLSCGTCTDVLTSCGPSFTCSCGTATTLYSPGGLLDPGRRAVSPDGRWYASAAGLFSAAGQKVGSLDDAKAFAWHPRLSGRYAVMFHFAPPIAPSLIAVQQIADDGQSMVVGRAEAAIWYHAMAWADDERLALGSPNGCTTAITVTPLP